MCEPTRQLNISKRLHFVIRRTVTAAAIVRGVRVRGVRLSPAVGAAETSDPGQFKPVCPRHDSDWNRTARVQVIVALSRGKT